MSRYQAYPEYKDSGLQWLGDMPSHWALRKSKYVFNRVQRDVRPEDGVVTAFRDGQVTLRSNRRTEGFTESIKEIGYQGVRKGDLLVHAMDGFAGAIGVSDSDGKCSPVCSVCVPTDHEQVHVAYFGYLVRQLAVTDFISSLAKGIRERSTEFRYSEFSVLDLALPPQNEQEKISAFLNHETAKIDALIEKQQRLIELLKEKRQAVISHSVTKGLNPNAPMKDSGVEWLGEVPAHWDVLKLGYLMKLKGGAGFPDGYQGQEGHEIPFYKVGDLARANSESCLTEPLHTVTQETAKELRATIFSTGSIVFAKVGAALLLKRFCTLNKPSCIDNNMMGAEIRSIELREFLLFVMPLLDFELIVNPGAVPSVNGEQITSILIALPPQDEQIEIVDFLRTSRIKFDHLIRNAEQAISLFQERRTALISAAVTGKIDVRDWQAAA